MTFYSIEGSFKVIDILLVKSQSLLDHEKLPLNCKCTQVLSPSVSVYLNLNLTAHHCWSKLTCQGFVPGIQKGLDYTKTLNERDEGLPDVWHWHITGQLMRWLRCCVWVGHRNQASGRCACAIIHKEPGLMMENNFRMATTLLDRITYISSNQTQSYYWKLFKIITTLFNFEFW